jgi:hypothetical protein
MEYHIEGDIAWIKIELDQKLFDREILRGTFDNAIKQFRHVENYAVHSPLLAKLLEARIRAFILTPRTQSGRRISHGRTGA